MSSFPGSPRLLKGAIIGLDPANPLASIVVFQYNPDTIPTGPTTRTTSPEANTQQSSVVNILSVRF